MLPTFPALSPHARGFLAALPRAAQQGERVWIEAAANPLRTGPFLGTALDLALASQRLPREAQPLWEREVPGMEALRLTLPLGVAWELFGAGFLPTAPTVAHPGTLDLALDHVPLDTPTAGYAGLSDAQALGQLIPKLLAQGQRWHRRTPALWRAIGFHYPPAVLEAIYARQADHPGNLEQPTEVRGLPLLAALCAAPGEAWELPCDSTAVARRALALGANPHTRHVFRLRQRPTDADWAWYQSVEWPRNPSEPLDPTLIWRTGVPLVSLAVATGGHLLEPLLDAGADPNALDDQGWAPLTWALLHYTPNSSHFQPRDRMVRHLLLHGADPQARNCAGRRPLEQALAELSEDGPDSLGESGAFFGPGPLLTRFSDGLAWGLLIAATGLRAEAIRSALPARLQQAYFVGADARAALTAADLSRRLEAQLPRGDANATGRTRL